MPAVRLRAQILDPALPSAMHRRPSAAFHLLNGGLTPHPSTPTPPWADWCRPVISPWTEVSGKRLDIAAGPDPNAGQQTTIDGNKCMCLYIRDSTEKMRHFKRILKILHCKTAHVCTFIRMCLKAQTTDSVRRSELTITIWEVLYYIQLKYTSVQFFKHNCRKKHNAASINMNNYTIYKNSNCWYINLSDIWSYYLHFNSPVKSPIFTLDHKSATSIKLHKLHVKTGRFVILVTSKCLVMLQFSFYLPVM